jgi:hypothetical protein
VELVEPTPDPELNRSLMETCASGASFRVAQRQTGQLDPDIRIPISVR